MFSYLILRGFFFFFQNYLLSVFLNLLTFQSGTLSSVVWSFDFRQKCICIKNLLKCLYMSLCLVSFLQIPILRSHGVLWAQGLRSNISLMILTLALKWIYTEESCLACPQVISLPWSRPATCVIFKLFLIWTSLKWPCLF